MGVVNKNQELKFIKYFDKILNELDNLSKSLSSTIFEEYQKLEERDLKYEDGAIGITELLQCPIKAKLRREIEDQIEIKSNEITDGFIFEHLIKLILTKLFSRARVKPEKELPLELYYNDEDPENSKCKINGHLDIFLDLTDTDDNIIVGLELKSTVLQHDNKIFDKPPPLLILDPNDYHRIDINHKYILQVQIQRYILEKLYPDKNIETYLFIKTQLRTKYKIGKTFIVLPITESIDESLLKKLCEEFYNNPYPRFAYECKKCIYKEHGFCDGFDNVENSSLYFLDNRQQIEKLLTRREELLKELEQIEQQLMKQVHKPFKYNNKFVGWIDEPVYDIEWIFKYLSSKDINPFEFLELKQSKLKKLKKIIPEEILNKFIKRTRKKFVLP